MILNPKLVILLLISIPILIYFVIKTLNIDINIKIYMRIILTGISAVSLGIYYIYSNINDYHLNLTEYQQIQEEPIEYPKYIYVPQKKNVGLRIKEYVDNIKYIDSIELINPNIKSTIRTVFEDYDEDQHEVIITTVDDNVRIHELTNTFAYIYIKDIDINTQKELGFSEEFYQTINTLPYSKLILILTDNESLLSSNIEESPNNIKSQIVDNDYPYWIKPYHLK